MVLANPGRYFENWVGLEIWKRLPYAGTGRLSHFRTKAGAAVDYVVEQPGRTIAIEVTWTDRPSIRGVTGLVSFLRDHPHVDEGSVICRCPRPARQGPRTWPPANGCIGVVIVNDIDNPHPYGHTVRMIDRVLAPRLRALARAFPIVTVTGPRQSGKTTLCRAVFPRKAYVSLEAPDVRAFAIEDPRGFLAQYPHGAVLDEVQRAPDLLSYLQDAVDQTPARGRFVLTGSANFALLASVTQSLAGRTALLNLLPLGLEEVRRFGPPPSDLDDLLWRGSYPAVYDRRVDPAAWYAGYVGTYLERDVRTLLAVGDLVAFQTFLGLAAGRVGQLVNLSALGADAGITHNTARAWLSVLEASYIGWRVRPYHANVSKRLIKTAKLHFLDTGLVCYLLGIRSPSDLRRHPLRGPIFECWVASEIAKHRAHRGLQPALSFFQDQKGHEVDLLIDRGRTTVAVEAKSGQTVASDFFRALGVFRSVSGAADPGRRIQNRVVYGGAERQRRTGVDVLPWSAFDEVTW